VWHDGEPFEAFTRNVPQFMSEFGFQSFPSIGTLVRFSHPKDWSIDSAVMLAHQKHPRGNEVIESYMKRYYRDPCDFESFMYVSQLLQAEGMKMGIEAHRRAKPSCMGSLFWQLDDCWPAASWSSIDYNGNPKALYYYARDAFNEVLVSPVIENDTVRVYVVSDRPEPFEGSLAMRLVDFHGNVIWETRHRLKIRANSARRVFEDDAAHLLNGEKANGVVLSAELREGGELLSRNLLYFVPPRELDLPRVAFARLDITPTGIAEVTGSLITLRTDVLAKNVYLSVPGSEGYFDDNYFDMLPGSTVRVRFITNENIENFDGKIRIMSLVDTY
jgi:beta-mannosidase